MSLLEESPPWDDGGDGDSAEDGGAAPGADGDGGARKAGQEAIAETAAGDTSRDKPAASLQPSRLPLPVHVPNGAFRLGFAPPAGPPAPRRPVNGLPTPPTTPAKRPPEHSPHKKPFPTYPTLMDINSTTTHVVVKEVSRVTGLSQRLDPDVPRILRTSVVGVFFDAEQAAADALERLLVDVELACGDFAAVSELREAALTGGRPFAARLQDAQAWLARHAPFAARGEDTVVYRVERTEFQEPRPVTDAGFRARFRSPSPANRSTPPRTPSPSARRPAPPPAPIDDPSSLAAPVLDPSSGLPVILPLPLHPVPPLPAFSGRYHPTHITHPRPRPLLDSELPLAALDLSLDRPRGREWGSCYLVEGISCRLSGPCTLGEPELEGWDLDPDIVPRRDPAQVLRMSWAPTSVMASRLTPAQRAFYAKGTARAELRLLKGGWAVLVLEFPERCWVGLDRVVALCRRDHPTAA
ncbi:hypothetical protein DFJ74DRAFT_700537 [Hyaloraphidium curvatum]|nr:hypothetical protein DFJ74DRAFT_700537 [Hyaloraphidium curvatum]